MTLGMDYIYLQALAILPCILFSIFFVLFKKPFVQNKFKIFSLSLDCFILLGCILFAVVVVNPPNQQMLGFEMENNLSILAICCFALVLTLGSLIVLWYSLRTMFYLIRFKLKNKNSKRLYKEKTEKKNLSKNPEEEKSWFTSFYTSKNRPEGVQQNELFNRKKHSISKHPEENELYPETNQVTDSPDFQKSMKKKKKMQPIKLSNKFNMSSIQESSLSQEQSIKENKSDKGSRIVQQFEDSDIKISITKPGGMRKKSETSRTQYSNFREKENSRKAKKFNSSEEFTPNVSPLKDVSGSCNTPLSLKESDFHYSKKKPDSEEDMDNRDKPVRSVNEHQKPKLNQARRLSYISSNFSERHSGARNKGRPTLTSYRKDVYSDDDSINCQ
jgi:hypothetical protein